jgi:hypothetical protein
MKDPVAWRRVVRLLDAVARGELAADGRLPRIFALPVNTKWSLAMAAWRGNIVFPPVI